MTYSRVGIEKSRKLLGAGAQKKIPQIFTTQYDHFKKTKKKKISRLMELITITE